MLQLVISNLYNLGKLSPFQFGIKFFSDLWVFSHKVEKSKELIELNGAEHAVHLKRERYRDVREHI